MGGLLAGLYPSLVYWFVAIQILNLQKRMLTRLRGSNITVEVEIDQGSFIRELLGDGSEGNGRGMDKTKNFFLNVL